MRFLVMSLPLMHVLIITGQLLIEMQFAALLYITADRITQRLQ